MLWVPIDARATVAAGLLLLPLIIAPLAIHVRDGYGQSEVLGGAWFWRIVVGTLALLGAGALGLRRQARI